MDNFIKQLRSTAPKMFNVQAPASRISPQASLREQPGTFGYDADNGVYSYITKQGDTLGQIIKDAGLITQNGLWGPNGDAEYYMKQLDDQKVWGNGERGVLPIGKKIFFKKREEENPDQSNPEDTATSDNSTKKVETMIPPLIKALRDLKKNKKL